MIRALITAALATGALHHFLGVPVDVALGYSVAFCIASWYLWPLLRRPIRSLLRRLRPHRRRTTNTPTRHPTTPPAHVTQINHYHYYIGAPHRPATSTPDYTLRALPRRTNGRIASDHILDGIIDTDG